ncbi:SDR family NAD(P)-dependent oxidoreductase [Candidatus Woesearchaeota archaeon]|jgi:NADP-dependent 3-hydroxy acid dehydrogenase YdfG|nr:SDR family NAD(P)-dependent oxidoreductase [Candidatus Woesearchaeota archaeon]MBT3538241.1 SDR family NAD(P)-dependent oxidoreductase [Candidatus Woesearchaeota archaeon]MBT4697695.1 SDR family NAD(P)-dependent oxidoreductase [Candidatus Woesearchaeota archaeon]MBT4717407.1 SDR family NAD(P)-dependent oxidoreductase [Candidatus Woesearchaeota archaeon]MBT7105910.1 SDR family NAD(P)-dependent oxidoreductase [Candidatus Woesearchaeota archaeon]
MVKTQLVVISGVTGSLGQAYATHYHAQDCKVVGLSRQPASQKLESVDHLVADLLDKKTTTETINRISLENITNILVIHPVGRFIFENEFREIDPKIYASNVETFKNVARPLIRSQIPATLVGFGSISDKYNIPFWGSYSRSKRALREYMQTLAYNNDNIRSVFLNLSSVKTLNESRLRPFADTSYWLTPEEIIERSVHELTFRGKWKEVDIFNLSPDFSPEIYTDHQRLKERWLKEMYGEI